MDKSGSANNQQCADPTLSGGEKKLFLSLCHQIGSKFDKLTADVLKIDVSLKNLSDTNNTIKHQLAEMRKVMVSNTYAISKLENRLTLQENKTKSFLSALESLKRGSPSVASPDESTGATLSETGATYTPEISNYSEWWPTLRC